MEVHLAACQRIAVGPWEAGLEAGVEQLVKDLELWNHGRRVRYDTYLDWEHHLLRSNPWRSLSNATSVLVCERLQMQCQYRNHLHIQSLLRRCPASLAPSGWAVVRARRRLRFCLEDRWQAEVEAELGSEMWMEELVGWTLVLAGAD